MNNIANTNGIATTLQEELTVGYKPQVPAEAMWAVGDDMPQITLRRDIEFMQMHPIVINALKYYRSGIAGAEFWGGPDYQNLQNEQGKPISPDDRVSQFVLAHCERFWQRAVPLIQEGAYPYGWAAGEHIYKEASGYLVWSHMRDFHPNDAFIITLGYQPIGTRIKNVRGKQPVDLWFASNNIPAKACWYPHQPRFGQFYGRSQLTGAWLPWRMIGWRDGMDTVINAAVYRAGYKGPIVRHPVGGSPPTAQTGIPATQLDGQGMSRRDNRDVARQMIEYAKAGAGFTMSSENYPDAQGGGKKWEIEWPDHVMDVSPLIEAARWCEDRIMLGIGVPPELVQAGGTGSGYSGRSIPREAFLDGQQRIADAMLQIFVEQVLRPLVLWNFGNIPFNVSCKPLLKSQAENKQGGVEEPLPQPAPDQGQPADAQSGPNGGQPGALPTAPTALPLGQTAPAGMSLSLDKRYANVVGIVQRVLQRRVA